MNFFDDILDAIQPVIVAETIQAAPVLAPEEPLWLYSLCKDTLNMVDMDPQPHYDICNIFEAAVGDCKFNGNTQKLVMVGVPRGTFKTSIATEGLPLGILDRNPNARILIDSFRHDVSKKRLKAVAGHITRNAEFHSIYGDDWKPLFREEQWNDTGITISKRTKVLREPSIDTSGVDRSQTGSHYDCIIADDLVTDTNCRTAEARQKVYDHIMDLLPILEPGGTLVLIFTRWHPDDAYGRLIRIDEERARAGKPVVFQKLIRSCYDGPNGLYFPTRHDHEFLTEQRERLGSRKFSAQYLNQPVADSDKTFKMEFLSQKSFEFYRNSRQGVIRTEDGQYPVYTTMAWDTAGSRPSIKSDYHGITIVGTDNFNRMWVPIAEGIKGTPTEVVQRVVAHIIYYRPDLVLIEAVGAYLHWLDAVQRQLEPLGISTAFEEVSHGGVPKEARIEQLEPFWSARRIILSNNLHDLVSQLDSFSPNSLPDHDDIMDSLSMHIGYTRPGDEVESTEKVNPVDDEWLRRRLRQRRDEGHPWRRGTKWQT